eukprot:gnl/TRDRNA2_/TRDRNA2_164330_c0_seq1.p1 gnl/TRDRNA2_/TRDRNA2_164330_c0~~gnl/TRDRNA2_/TRDRNA2_164330_c0_seq1.p1  ORF type:complete len:440 (+),score=39.49 gnl/TRDRNA2_/TRDRNA2_164330_c0_seq1:195-1514(+)
MDNGDSILSSRSEDVALRKRSRVWRPPVTSRVLHCLDRRSRCIFRTVWRLWRDAGFGDPYPRLPTAALQAFGPPTSQDDMFATLSSGLSRPQSSICLGRGGESDSRQGKRQPSIARSSSTTSICGAAIAMSGRPHTAHSSSAASSPTAGRHMPHSSSPASPPTAGTRPHTASGVAPTSPTSGPGQRSNVFQQFLTEHSDSHSCVGDRFSQSARVLADDERLLNVYKRALWGRTRHTALCHKNMAQDRLYQNAKLFNARAYQMGPAVPLQERLEEQVTDIKAMQVELRQLGLSMKKRSDELGLEGAPIEDEEEEAEARLRTRRSSVLNTLGAGLKGLFSISSKSLEPQFADSSDSEDEPPEEPAASRRGSKKERVSLSNGQASAGQRMQQGRRTLSIKSSKEIAIPATGRPAPPADGAIRRASTSRRLEAGKSTAEGKTS